MFNKTQLETMLALQHKMNSKVNPDWINANYNWNLAAMMEASEAIDHHGWKWWKKQEPDMPQLQMELVDIWHFALSHILVVLPEYSIKEVAAQINDLMGDSFKEDNPAIFNNIEYTYNNSSLLELLVVFIGSCAQNALALDIFQFMVFKSGMTSDDLYKQYLGKNVLNFFRQDNGYKEGTYIKVWFDSREDNEHLVDILNELDMNENNADIKIYENLKYRYLQNT